jgi:hypothetical protein
LIFPLVFARSKGLKDGQDSCHSSVIPLGFLDPLHTYGQTQDQKPLPNLFEQQQSSYNKPLDLSLDASLKAKKNANVSDKIHKNQQNKVIINPSLKQVNNTNLMAPNVKQAKDSDFKTPATLLGAYGQSYMTSGDKTFAPFTSYLTRNRSEDSLTGSLNLEIKKREKRKHPKEDEDGLMREKNKMLNKKKLN